MKETTRPSLKLALITVMIASPCFAQGVTSSKAENSITQQEEVKTIFSFKNEIGLSDEQENKLKALLYDEQTLINQNNITLKALGVELGKMIDANAEMQVIKGKLEEIAKIQVDVSYRNIEDGRKVKTLLTPAQLDKWKEIQKKFSAQPKATP